MAYSKPIGNVTMITSLKDSIFWLEDDGVIRRARVEAAQIIIEQEIQLGTNELISYLSCRSRLKFSSLFNIVRTYVIHRF